MRYTCIISPGGLNNTWCNIILLWGRRTEKLLQRRSPTKQTVCFYCAYIGTYFTFRWAIWQQRIQLSQSLNLLCSFLREFIKTQWTLTILHYPLLTAKPSLWREERREGQRRGDERRAIFRQTKKPKPKRGKNDSDVNLWSYCSLQTILVLFPLSFIFIFSNASPCFYHPVSLSSVPAEHLLQPTLAEQINDTRTIYRDHRAGLCPRFKVLSCSVSVTCHSGVNPSLCYYLLI